MGLLDRLSTLNRDFREIEITSMDKEKSEVGYYRRPTEVQDDILKKAMNEEYETILAGLKDGETSVFNTLTELFKNSPKELSVDALVAAQANDLRLRAVRELGKEEPSVDATQEQRDAFIAELKPHFEQLVEDLKKVLAQEPEDVLPVKAAQARIEGIARDRAFEIYRRRLISQSLYEKDEESGQFELVFKGTDKVEPHQMVPEHLDTDTINTIASRIIEEMNRVRNLPLK